MNSDKLFEKTQKVAALMNASKKIVVFTGAGISVPSGIPDFRSNNTGLWEKFDPIEVASLSAFKHQPEKFFNWLQPLTRKIQESQPNPAHSALAQLESAGKISAILTQNIDHLHQLAGSKNVIELHGTLKKYECYYCGASNHPNDKLLEQFIYHNKKPMCGNCGQYLKPAITLFEEMLPEKAWNSAINQIASSDMVIVIGSSLEVSPANNLPNIALKNNAKLIINTLSNTHLDSCAEVLLPFNVAEVWPSVVQLLTKS
jgi:NAD-dependent deacetylase